MAAIKYGRYVVGYDTPMVIRKAPPKDGTNGR